MSRKDYTTMQLDMEDVVLRNIQEDEEEFCYLSLYTPTFDTEPKQSETKES